MSSSARDAARKKALAPFTRRQAQAPDTRSRCHTCQCRDGKLEPGSCRLYLCQCHDPARMTD